MKKDDNISVQNTKDSLKDTTRVSTNKSIYNFEVDSTILRTDNVGNIIGGDMKDWDFDKNNYKEKSKEKYVQIEFLKDFFTTYYFVNDLKIPEGRVLEFLDYCYMNFNFKQLLKNNNTEEILYTLNEQAPIYLSKITSNE